MRREKGIRTREEYLAERQSTPKPWLAEGISRRTWQRRIARQSQTCHLASPDMSRGDVETTDSKERTHRATTERDGDARGGPSRKRSDGRPVSVGESKQAESQQQGGLSALRPHQATPESEPRLNALNDPAPR